MSESSHIRRLVNSSILDMTELNEWQQAAIILLGTKAEHKMSYERIAEQIGVSAVTLYKFRQRKDVKDYILRYNMARVIDRIPEVVEAQIDSAVSRKNTKAAELVLKYAGLLVERREVSADVKADINTSDKSNEELQAELEQLRAKLDSN